MQIGDIVEYNTQGGWLQDGKIIAINNDGTYNVQCKDGNIANNWLAQNVRYPSPPNPTYPPPNSNVPVDSIPPPVHELTLSNPPISKLQYSNVLQVNDFVDYNTTNGWQENGRIIKVNSNGSYDLDCVGQGLVAGWQAQNVRRCTLQANQMVNYSTNQGWKSGGRIISSEGNDMYTLEMNNGEKVNGWKRENLRKVDIPDSVPPLEVVKNPNDKNDIPSLEIVTSEPNMKIGDNVEYNTSDGWQEGGKIIGINADGTFNIQCNNGQIANQWYAKNVRSPIKPGLQASSKNVELPETEALPQIVPQIKNTIQETSEQAEKRNKRLQEIIRAKKEMSKPGSSTIKRLRKDLMSLLKNPLPDASAHPSDNMLLWHLNFMVPITIDGELKKAPLHAVMTFPKEYPMKAPNVGFCTDFYYNMGAHYIEKKGPLKGMKVICIDILGNFHSYHTNEWVMQQGTGWTAAYTVETVLVNLQSLLIQLDSKMKTDEDRKKFYNNCLKYKVDVDGEMHTGTNPWPPVRSYEDIVRENKIVKNVADISIISDLLPKVESFVIKAGWNSIQKNEFIRLLIQAKQSVQERNGKA